MGLDPKISVARLPTEPVLLAAREAAGEAPCHLVGGYLRDHLLGREARSDFDLVVAGDGREIALRLARTLGARFVVLGGKEFAAFRLVLRDPAGDVVIDLWDRESASLHKDLARRDFTVNSIALDLAGGEIVDPFDGVGDLRRKRLRATTRESFTGDPLRILRLPRFQVGLPGFEIEPMTLRLAAEAAGGLKGVAAERIREELGKIFASSFVHRGIETLMDLGVYPSLFLSREIGTANSAEDRRIVGRLRRLEAVIEELRELYQGLTHDPGGEIDPALARLALVFASLLDDPPREHLAQLAGNGLWTRKTLAALDRLFAQLTLPGDSLGIRRFLHHQGERWATAVAVAGALAEGTAERSTWKKGAMEIAALIRKEGARLIRPPVLLDGRELQRLLEIEPGPEVGSALEDLERAQIDGDVGTRDEAIAFIRRRAGEE